MFGAHGVRAYSSRRAVGDLHHPRGRPDRTRVHRPARPRPARRAIDQGVRARGRGSRRPGPAVPGLLPGRPRPRGRRARPSAGELSGWLDRALQDFRVLLLDQRGTGRSTPVGALPGLTPEEQADVPHPLPRRLDRARRRVIRARARRRTLERARPELRRLLRDDLPLDRARGAARGVHHRRAPADRPPHRRRLPRDLRADRSRATGATSSATRTTATRVRRCSAARREDVRLPSGGRLTAAPVPPGRQRARHQRRVRARCTTCSSSRSTRPRSCTTRGGVGFDAQPDLRDRCTNLATRTASPRAGRRSGCCPPACARTRAASPASTSSRGCSRRTARCAPLREAAELLAEHAWPRALRRRRARGERGPRRRGDLQRRPLRRARLLRGDRRADPRPARPWITNEYEHNGLRADGGRCSAG